jgi:hypothetical protein
MQRLQISLTKTQNAKYQRVGALSQGQFQAVAVETGEQLIQLTAYVHCNPVLAGLARRPEDREYSSCREYLGARPGTLPRPDMVLELCGGWTAYGLLLRPATGEAMDDMEHLVLEE